MMPSWDFPQPREVRSRSSTSMLFCWSVILMEEFFPQDFWSISLPVAISTVSNQCRIPSYIWGVHIVSKRSIITFGKKWYLHTSPVNPKDSGLNKAIQASPGDRCGNPVKKEKLGKLASEQDTLLICLVGWIIGKRFYQFGSSAKNPTFFFVGIPSWFTMEKKKTWTPLEFSTSSFSILRPSLILKHTHVQYTVVGWFAPGCAAYGCFFVLVGSPL